MANEGNEQAPVANSEVIEDQEQPPEPSAEAPDNAELSEGEEQPQETEVAFRWQATEYVHHHKSAGWYAGLIGVIVVLVGGAALLGLWLYIAVFLIMGVAVFVYARKPPRVMTYELSAEGVHIDGKLFPFAIFRSFGVMPDDEWHSIDLEPAKRFSPRMVLLFNEENFEEIVGHLELHLPRVDRQPDMIERLTRYLRF